MYIELILSIGIVTVINFARRKHHGLRLRAVSPLRLRALQHNHAVLLWPELLQPLQSAVKSRIDEHRCKLIHSLDVKYIYSVYDGGTKQTLNLRVFD